jgi:hypothetical protein
MKMKQLLWILLASAGLTYAQEKPAEPQSRLIIQVKYVNPADLARLLSVPSTQVLADQKMRAIVVSGPASAVSTIEEMAKKLDVAPPAPAPKPNIELTGYLVFGSAQAKSDEVPAELAPAIKQLRSSFQYKSYRMADSFVIRGRDSQGVKTGGLLPKSGDDLPPASYEFKYSFATVSEGSPRVVHIENLEMDVKIPVATYAFGKDGDKNSRQFSFMNADLRTNIDIREGQKVVVGKSNINASDDAMILIITAKIVE